MGCLTRRRHTLVLLLVLIFVPFCAFIIFAEPDLSLEQELTSKMAELQMRIQHLDSLHQERLQEVRILSHYLSNIVSTSKSENLSVGAMGVDSEAQKLLHNLTTFDFGSNALHMPSVFHFLPHLLHNPASLKPAYRLSKGRSGASMVLGVPTVKREVQSYLLTTLHNLVQNLNPEEQSKTLIIVFVAETDLEYVESVAREIEMQFSPHVEAGLIEVISPPASYYPDLSNLTPSLGDSPERFKWRTKQNLDFAFLMMYAQPRGIFYTQLEDDILAKPGFLTTMLNFAYQKIAKNESWFVIEFCQLGFIGKMFKCVELPWLVEFFIMFYTDKPVDWLLDHVITTKICSLDKDQKMCKKAKNQLWLHFKPSLFQHIGTHSSLKGKVQKLKDKHFGKLMLFYPHTNNPKTSNIKGGVTSYKQHTLVRAYAGEDYFWGLSPQAGDSIVFSYDPPINLSRYLFRSGNAEHPSDKFYNTTIEILPLKTPSSDLNVTPDGYVIVGKFDTVGIAEGFVNPKLFPIKELKISIHSESDNWVILNEILIEIEQKSES